MFNRLFSLARSFGVPSRDLSHGHGSARFSASLKISPGVHGVSLLYCWVLREPRPTKLPSHFSRITPLPAPIPHQTPVSRETSPKAGIAVATGSERGSAQL